MLYLFSQHKNFRIRLMDNAKKNRLIAKNGIYELIWQRLPCSLTIYYELVFTLLKF